MRYSFALVYSTPTSVGSCFRDAYKVWSVLAQHIHHQALPLFILSHHTRFTFCTFLTSLEMRQTLRCVTLAIGLAATANAGSNSTLASLCTVSNVQSLIPANSTLLGIDLLPSTVAANVVYNATLGGGSSSSVTNSTVYNYCNVTVSYTHSGKNDLVVTWYTFPSPETFKNRFYVAGGGGYSLSSDPTGGLTYGAVAGVTDAGYDAFSNSYDTVVLAGNGSLIYDNMHSKSTSRNKRGLYSNLLYSVWIQSIRRDDNRWEDSHQGILQSGFRCQDLHLL